MLDKTLDKMIKICFTCSKQMKTKTNSKSPKIIEKLLEQGYTKSDIASRLGVSEMTIYRWKKELFVPKRAFIEVLEKMAED